MNRKTAITLMLSAAVMPQIKAQEDAKKLLPGRVMDLDVLRVAQSEDYTISFVPNLKRLHIEVAGKKFTFTTAELAAALAG